METRKKRLKKSHEEIVENCNFENQITIHKLNDDCLTNIFQFLQIIDRVKIESVCKHWRDVGKKSWQNVKTLDKSVAIWGFDIHTKIHWVNDIFRTVLQRCGFFLRRLDLSSMYMMNNYVLQYAGKFCPNLQFIDVGLVKLTLTTVRVWTKNLHNLTEIAFGHSTKFCNDTQLSKLFLQNKQLQSLKITRNDFLTGECLLSLPVNMKAIVIQGGMKISFNHLNNALEQFEQLETFSLTSVNKGLPDKINSMPTTLKNLQIRWCINFNIDFIIPMKNLEKLVLNGQTLVTDAFLVSLVANCKTLYHLNLDDCNQVTNVGLQAVVSLPKIEYLNLVNLCNITDSALTYVPNLKKLYCSGCRNIKDDGICTLIETCNSLEVLDLSYCSRITNNLLECAINVTNNRTNNVVLILDLRGTSVDPDEFLTEYRLLRVTLPSSSNSSFGGIEDYWFDDYDPEDYFDHYDNFDAENNFEEGEEDSEDSDFIWQIN